MNSAAVPALQVAAEDVAPEEVPRVERRPRPTRDALG